MNFSGYVAFVDLLGFSRGIQGDSLDGFFPSYRAAFTSALDPKSEFGVRYVVSSDSIVLYTKTDSQQALVSITIGCARLFHELMNISLPIRGCISQGKLTAEDTANGTFIAGAPIVEAYHYERQQDWVGIMLSPRVIEKNPHILTYHNLKNAANQVQSRRPEFRGTGERLIKRWDIPFHDDGRGKPALRGFAIVPTLDAGGSVEEYTQGLELMIAKAESLAAIAPDPSAQRKHERTLEFLRHCLVRARE